MDTAQGQSAGKNYKLNKNTFYYLSGFVDGEGAFTTQTRKTPWTHFGFTITPEFKICQHKDGVKVLEILQKALRCGKISVKSGQPKLMVLVEKNRRNLSEKIIPFFKRYPLIIKQKQFKNFCLIVKGLEKGEQNTKEGFEKLIDLVFQKHSGKGKRKYSKEEVLSSPQRLHAKHK